LVFPIIPLHQNIEQIVIDIQEFQEVIIEEADVEFVNEHVHVHTTIWSFGLRWQNIKQFVEFVVETEIAEDITHQSVEIVFSHVEDHIFNVDVDFVVDVNFVEHSFLSQDSLPISGSLEFLENDPQLVLFHHVGFSIKGFHRGLLDIDAECFTCDFLLWEAFFVSTWVYINTVDDDHFFDVHEWIIFGQEILPQVNIRVFEEHIVQICTWVSESTLDFTQWSCKCIIRHEETHQRLEDEVE
jgi:hypothetical protein